MQTPTAPQAEIPAASAVSPTERARHISFAEMLRLTGDGKTRAYAQIADPSSAYPKPCKAGRSNRFILGEVLDYLESMAAGRVVAKAGGR